MASKKQGAPPGSGRGGARTSNPPVERYAARLKRKGRFVLAEYLFEKERVVVEKGAASKYGPDEIVLVEPRVGGQVKVVGSLGEMGSCKALLSALVADRKLRPEFEGKVEAEARQVKASDAGRRDLTDLVSFTIDPVSAKDHDDAISVEREGDGLRLYVHIADVSTYVGGGSEIDTEARARGCSVYLPDRVTPMLPEGLSNNLCSLRPNEVRNAVTVELLYNSAGEAAPPVFYRSKIKSWAKLSYSEVQRLFDGKPSKADDLSEWILRARGLARALHRKRQERGALIFQTSEPSFSFDSKGEPDGVKQVRQTEANNLIEELMVEANSQVASYLEQQGVGLLYRIHQQPEAESIEFLVQQLADLKVPTPPVPDSIAPSEAGELVGEIAAAIERYLRKRRSRADDRRATGGQVPNGALGAGGEGYRSLLLRSMQQAVYSPKNIGHAGLASPSYAHFTSPIRRYPDLVVHRALMAELGLGKAEPAHGLEAEGWHCSAMERAAVQVERDASAICLAYLLKQELDGQGWDKKFEGEVVGLIGAGAFVRFGSYEGFLSSRMLGGGYYRVNELGTVLYTKRGGRTIRLGDPVSVKVERVDWHRGRTDLVPAK